MRRLLPLLLVVAAWGQSTTAVIPSQFFGLHWYYNNPYPVVPFGSMRLWDTNATRWQVMNPNTFTNLDNVLSTAKTNGYPTDIMLSLGATPKSISSDPTNTVCAYNTTASGSCGVPTDIAISCTNVNALNNCDGKTDGTNQTWRTYLYNLATHLAGLSPATYQPVTSIEIWNEFTSQSGAIFGQWEGTAAQMVRMYQDANCIFTGRGTITSQGGATCTAGHLGVPAVGIIPTMVVTTPNSVMAVSGASALFGTYLGTTGALNSVDAVAAHTYTGSPFPTVPEKVATFFTTLNGYLVSASSSCAAIPLGCWSTEGSWGNNTPNEPDLDMQAAFIARYYLVGWASGWQRMYEYAYTANNVGTLWVANGSSGCVVVGGCLTKAGIAYQNTYQWMVGNKMSTLCSNIAGTTWTCTIGGLALIVWDTSQTCSGGSCGTVSFTIPAATYVSYSSLDGTTTPIGSSATTVQVGAKPIRLNGCGAPLYLCSSNSTANPGAISSIFTATSPTATTCVGMCQNSTAYDTTLNPTGTDCYSRITDGTTFPSGASPGSFTHSGGDNDIMGSKNGTYLGIQVGSVYIFHMTVDAAGCYKVLNTGIPSMVVTGPFGFSKVNDKRFYNITNFTQLQQNDISGTVPTESFTTTQLVDISAAGVCPGINWATFGTPSSGSIMGIKYDDSRFGWSVGPGGQASADWTFVWDKTLGCSSVNFNTGQYWAFCSASCGPSTPPTGTFTLANNNCWGSNGSTGHGIHDSQMSGDGNYMVVTAQINVLGVNTAWTGGICAPYTYANQQVIWQIGTGGNQWVYGNTTVIAHAGPNAVGHASAGQTSYISDFFAGPNIRSDANVTAFSTFFQSVAFLPDEHCSWPHPLNDDSYPWICASDLVTSPAGGGNLAPTYLQNTVYAWFPGTPYPPGTPPRLFGHTFSCGANSNTTCPSGVGDFNFGAQESIGFVTQDGKFFCFESSMLQTLGLDNTGNPRADGFCIHLDGQLLTPAAPTGLTITIGVTLTQGIAIH